LKKLIWFATATAVVLWTLIAWGVHGLVEAAGHLAASHSDILPVSPELVEWASWLAQFGADIGGWLVVAVWAAVSFGILALGFIGARLARSLQSARGMSRFETA
jgi:hypothetical protein